MKAQLQERLMWLWENRATPVGQDRKSFGRARYVPRAFSSRGFGWGVFDRLKGRFLSDAEVAAIPMDHLKEATHLS